MLPAIAMRTCCRRVKQGRFAHIYSYNLRSCMSVSDAVRIDALVFVRVQSADRCKDPASRPLIPNFPDRT